MTGSPRADERSQRRAPARGPVVVVCYIGLLTAGAAVLAYIGWREHPIPGAGPATVVLTLLGVAGILLREREFGRDIGVSVTTVILAAAIPLAGPAGAVCVGYLSGVLGTGQRARNRFFNAGMTGLMAGVGGWTYVLLDGEPNPQDLGPFDLLWSVALPLGIAYAVMTGLNMLLIGVMAWLVSGMPPLAAAERTLAALGWPYVSHVLVGFLFVVLWGPAEQGAFAVVLILAPLFIAQWTLGRDAAERRSHERTVKTFVAALEMSEPWSAGHSARVALLCDRMGVRLGLDNASAEALRYAALLHDIGLVAVPLDTRKAGSLDLDYLIQVSEHPATGVRMLEEITFLADALPGILHHHERVDGKGYPAGLSGEDIPLAARVIAVADLFDSLTTTRSYREPLTADEALAVARSRVGTHLDGTVVEALAQVLETRPWAPTVIVEPVRSTVGNFHDHDEPAVSDLYAEWSPDMEVLP